MGNQTIEKNKKVEKLLFSLKTEASIIAANAVNPHNRGESVSMTLGHIVQNAHQALSQEEAQIEKDMARVEKLLKQAEELQSTAPLLFKEP